MSDTTLKTPLKVAILGAKGYPYVYGGYDTLVRELGERLVAKGVEVRVYCHRALFPEKPPMVNGIKLFYTPAIETKTLTQLSHSFISMMHACLSDVDVIFVVNSGNGPYGLLSKIFRKPTAINVDGLEWLRPKWRGLGSRYFKFASRLATKFYDRIVTDSFEMHRIYKEKFKTDSTVIAYGANPANHSNPELLKKWNLKPYDYFLIVGRLVPDNNADLILGGFLQSKTKRKLVIVGDVPFEDEFANKLKNIKDERVLFTGYVKDPEELKTLYNLSYAYFHGHEYGGTNPAMLKALGYGCAILALDTVFNREMLQNGKHGVFFEKETEQVTETIHRVEQLPEEMEALRKTARSGLTDMYNWDNVAEAYLKLFLELKSSKS
ncbi:glycosyltransferase [Arthrospiribacter ruber]|uniref:Glycosyltransferase family 1 protein n=1 Tax=Arthrospiribacter ruber TaxID=2487934 RepID=A0A951IU83_9BACT|nr:glycosyltransferase [Arthrospiribacter ruber]MBW3467525.1 glycosyltransferase family 1 protein [Arthrospiribacter ruber]